MKIITTKPPIYDDIIKGGMTPSSTTIYTYEDIIYNPSGVSLSEDVLVHEMKHSIQQKAIGVDVWWSKFILDPEFRVEQEVEAYAQQYKWICKYKKDPNQRVSILHKLAGILSSQIYGETISKGEAVRLIKEKANGR